MQRVLIVFLAFVVSFSFSSWVFAQDGQEPDTIEYLVTSPTVNLRSGPGTGFNVVGTASAGESLYIYDETLETTGWLRVYRNGEEDAYIADFLVERAPTRFYPVSQEPVVSLSGRGKQISDVLEFPTGAYRIDVTVHDNSFILKSITVNGDCRDESILNELNFDRNSLVLSTLFVSSGCSVIFETDNVDGNWEIEVRNILEEQHFLESMFFLDDGSSIAATGHTLSMPTMLAEGIWTISATVEDNAFILHAHVLDGDCNDTSVFNELDFDTEILEVSTVYRSDGCYIFWETSNVEEDWQIVFEKIG